MENPNIEPMLRAIKRFYRGIDQYKQFLNTDILDDELDGLINGVLQAYDIPEDTTTIYKMGDEKWLCNDYWFNIVMDYLDDKISFEILNKKMFEVEE